jgi:hypothetical protein
MLQVTSPALKQWKIEAHQTINTWILPPESEIMFDIEDMSVKFNTEFETTPEGYLKPVLYASDLRWGNTSIYHENFFLAMIFDQWIKFLLVIVQNSIYFLGD